MTIGPQLGGPRGTGRLRLMGVGGTLCVLAGVLVLWATRPSDSPPTDPPVAPSRDTESVRAPGRAAGDPRPIAPSPPASPRVVSPPATRPPEPPEPGPPDDTGLSVWFAPWGEAPGELGRTTPDEGAPEGPMSFAVDADGRAWVLDQVNERIEVFAAKGAPIAVPLPAGHYQDLALTPSGDVALLDRLDRGRALLLDAAGGLRSELALEGPGVPDAGGVTGLFARTDGLWVEVEHREMVRIADAEGRPDEQRPSVEGRFTADGARLVSAHLQRPDRVIVLVREATASGNAPRLLAEIAFSLPVLRLVALDFDAQGRVYVAVGLARFAESPPHAVVEQRIELAVLAPDGVEVNRLVLDAATGDAEQLRPIAIGADGAVYRLRLDDAGATMERRRPVDL